MDHNLSDLKRQIQALSADERRNLLNVLEFDEARTPFLPNRMESDVWDILLRLTPAPMHRSLNEFIHDRRHGVPKAAYCEAVETIRTLVNEASPVRHEVQDHLALATLVLTCLAQDLAARDIAINPKTIIDELPRLRTAVNRQFPGYVEARLLHTLIRTVAPEAAQ
jgi:hypothetical protein